MFKHRRLCLLACLACSACEALFVCLSCNAYTPHLCSPFPECLAYSKMSSLTHLTLVWHFLFISSTSLCSAGADGKRVTYHGSCISNIFEWNTAQQSASANKEGMVCPGLLISRPSSVSNTSAAFYNNVVSSDPLLYSYQYCTCAAPLVASYKIDDAGDIQGSISRFTQSCT